MTPNVSFPPNPLPCKPDQLHTLIITLCALHCFLLHCQNHNEEGEAGVREKMAKLTEDMHEQFRKLEE